jgi:tetratricopeptide (TPR) repeat protein
MLALQRQRGWIGAGIVGLVCLVLVGVGLSAYWAEKQRKGLRELEDGVAALQTGDVDRAAAQLTLAEHHLQAEGNEYLMQLVRLNQGYVAERQGDLSRAQQYYEASADMDGPAKSEALLATAHVLTLTKDDTGSVAMYKKFLEQAPESPVSELVRQKVGDK